MTCRPGHSPRHPDFEPGNQLSLKHGARSPRVIAQEAVKVHASLLEHAPWLDQPQFAPAVSRYLEATAREQLLHRFIEETSAEQGTGKVPSRTWEQATAATRLAASLGAELGLTPLGHARLKVVAGAALVTERTLGDLQSEGAAIRARRATGGDS